MPRPRIYPDVVTCRFPAGTLDDINAARRDGETHADLIREAVSREIARRKRAEKPARPVARSKGR